MIKKVTITGADDTISIYDLFKLSIEFPFVEWGILLSAKRHGTPRYPSKEFLQLLTRPWEFKGEKFETDGKWDKLVPNLSLHLCGQYVRDFLLGKFQFIDDIGIENWKQFKRVQINTHGELHEYEANRLGRFIMVNPDKEFIFQYDGTNLKLLEFIAGLQNCAVLHDLSSGAGILPTHWPDTFKNVFCGYAGGLGPQNLEEQIPKILAAAGENPIWIDMETWVRSGNGSKFDLDKVFRCLEISENFIPMELRNQKRNANG